jgi:hypothetical protein
MGLFVSDSGKEPLLTGCNEAGLGMVSHAPTEQ